MLGKIFKKNPSKKIAADKQVLSVGYVGGIGSMLLNGCDFLTRESGVTEVLSAQECLALEFESSDFQVPMLASPSKAMPIIASRFDEDLGFDDSEDGKFELVKQDSLMMFFSVEVLGVHYVVLQCHALTNSLASRPEPHVVIEYDGTVKGFDRIWLDKVAGKYNVSLNNHSFVRCANS
ncbi:hypothetical protein [Vibrio crassostreae]|uniref:hypothetical protein n=1 Tax=Vibrio crassostreae TaxID=246167 RepID=UPI001B30EB93|nr:hypothetical protein [Vibrio crassostreae]